MTNISVSPTQLWKRNRKDLKCTITPQNCIQGRNHRRAIPRAFLQDYQKAAVQVLEPKQILCLQYFGYKDYHPHWRLRAMKNDEWLHYALKAITTQCKPQEDPLCGLQMRLLDMMDYCKHIIQLLYSVPIQNKIDYICWLKSARYRVGRKHFLGLRRNESKIPPFPLKLGEKNDSPFNQ